VSDFIHLDTDVLIIGAGAAGMSAAIAAHDAGVSVLLADRSLIGRGGATVMAQMTVAAAVGEEVPDHWEHHLADTLKAGRSLCDGNLAQLLCEQAPAAIRQMDQWHVGWARHHDGRMRQTEAPGHDRPRCVYVDFLNTGPAVSRTLRAQVQRRDTIRRVGDLIMTELVLNDGEVCGAAGFALESGAPITIAASAVIIATGGVTRLYRRNSASANMGGDGHALALRAGAELIDMEFVQFFPIGHLAPRLVGMDPIMWDPFRYKLGGQLLNREGREFIGDYGAAEQGRYRATRDVATYAILKEIEAVRGSPSGGVYLSFRHIPEARLREAFGPVIDRLLANRIDLTRDCIEVSPIAHYHMGGIRVNVEMQSSVPGLFAAGEAVGGANGASRLSGNAIPEALVFGRKAGISAAAYARKTGAGAYTRAAAASALDLLKPDSRAGEEMAPAAILALQQLMDKYAGPLRSEAGLQSGLAEIARLETALPSRPPSAAPFADARRDWFDLRNMLLVARTIATAALSRRESRGAHQREDYPSTDQRWEVNQTLHFKGGQIAFESVPPRTHLRETA
jgi:succinate dehydrogenase / fumarate reductase flavoprotein subunit